MHYDGNIPQIKLEPFAGNFSKWLDFAAGFKALVHDAPITDHQRMTAKANIYAMANLPPVEMDDFRSLERFEGCFTDLGASLLKGGHSKELNSILVMEHVPSKLPLRREWGLVRLG